MEQRLRVDRTPVSEAQTFVAGALTDRDIDAAATKLLTTPSRSYAPLPEPGSPEAVAMFNAACEETDRLMLGARDGYPELRRVDGSSWTKRCLHKARDAGTIGVVEYARLYLLAAEREHRMEAASLATRIGALHALAYPDQFGPFDDAYVSTSDAAPNPDPVFSAIERYHIARAAGEAFSKRFEVEGAEALGGWGVANEEDLRLASVWSDLATEVLKTAPTTEAGRLALAAFIEMWVDDHGNLDGSPQDGSETVFAEVFPALLKALRTSVPAGFEPMGDVRTFLPKRATVARPPEPSPAAIPAGGLADACDWAVRHAAWLNEATVAEGWGNDRLDAEMTKYNLVWDRAISEPADTIQTLAAKVRMLKTSWLDNKGDEECDGLDKMILSVMRDIAHLERACPPLVDRLLDAWGEWAKTCPDGSTPDDEVALKRNEDARDRLISEVAALPATRENAVAKGIAGAWVEYLNSWEENAPRDSYGIDGRLCFDIHDAVTLAAVA